MALKDFLYRLKGLSTPLGGVSWDPPPDERQILYRLIQRLADRRLLNRYHGCWDYRAVIESLQHIRENITQVLGELSAESKARVTLENIRIAIHEFNTFIDQKYPQSEVLSEFEWIENGPPKDILYALREMRDVVSENINYVAVQYKINLSHLITFSLPRNIDSLLDSEEEL